MVEEGRRKKGDEETVASETVRQPNSDAKLTETDSISPTKSSALYSNVGAEASFRDGGNPMRDPRWGAVQSVRAEGNHSRCPSAVSLTARRIRTMRSSSEGFPALMAFIAGQVRALGHGSTWRSSIDRGGAIVPRCDGR